MTTREFINKAWNGQTRKKECSSVFYENGVVYSYGYHYPLLFKINGKTVRNVEGYSNTTERHIQWSRDIDAIDIHAGHRFRLSHDDNMTMSDLVEGQIAYINNLKEQMASKKRKDTQVYKWLKFDHDRACDNLALLRS